MVLAGHRPEVIMEICTRAISFWTYQVPIAIAVVAYVNSRYGFRHIKSISIKSIVIAKLMRKCNKWNLIISRCRQEEILKLLVSFSDHK